MKLEVNKIITLGNDEEYLVVDKVLKDDKEYYYIAQVNDEETDIKDNYKIAVITNEEWKTLKNDYVNNIKSGKKYQLREFENSLVDDEILNSEPTVVDKLFDLVGEDIIEFK